MLFKKIILAVLIVLGANFVSFGQKAGIKTNILADGFLSPNLGVEIGMSPKWTFDLTGEVNFWTVNEHKWKHWLVQPEFRYWFCERFAGHFIGFHALAGEYNFGNIHNDVKFLNNDFRILSHHRVQGWGAGAGFAYGYSWILADHWNLEAEIGVGWVYTRYDVYPCAECGTKLESNRVHNYVGPTKLSVALEYLF